MVHATEKPRARDARRDTWWKNGLIAGSCATVPSVCEFVTAYKVK